MKKNNIIEAKKVYFIGIKGAGMAALAELLKKGEGKKISGSDTGEVFFTDEILKNLGIKVYQDFSIKNIKKEKPDLIVYSTAYNQENIEVNYAVENNIPSLSYPEALGELMKTKYSVAVCGTHGKTTTTAMLALTMKECGKDPSAIVGSQMKQTGSNALTGKSEYLIVEADEYQDKFAYYFPTAVILTNLSYDHPDFFSSVEAYQQAFIRFIKKIPLHGFLAVCGNDARALEAAKEANCKLVIYGNFDETEEIQLAEEFNHLKKGNFEIIKTPEKFNLKVPGAHNLLNATAVYAFAEQFKLNKTTVIEALNNYEGVARRFEKIGENKGTIIIDDYAHHPEEIRATLKTARKKYSLKNIICVFQPHTYSRTEAFLESFAQSFEDCDEMIITDIYSSAREQKKDFDPRLLTEEIKKYKKNVKYLSQTEEAFNYLKTALSPKDVLITMGAGNIGELAKRLAQT